MDIKFIKREELKNKPSGELGFGKYTTDYMFTMDYASDRGWHNAQIRPYESLCLDPASMVLHYAQETFEGLKAYKTKDGRILLFRPEVNAKRFANSNRRLSMPVLDENDFVEIIEKLVSIERDWIPEGAGESLYIRPFMYASDVSLGVHPSFTYKFVVIVMPVGAYYPEGVNPVKIYVEDEYVRANVGGTGFTKCGGNYAGSLAAQVKAEKLGYTQVLWLDGVHRKYIEEVGSMNVMFKIDGQIYTAPCDGTVLPGVTRESIIHILKDMGYVVNEVHLSIEDLMKAGREGRLEEAFGTGTAAVISPVGELYYKGETVTINNFETGELTQKLYDQLTGIQWGNLKDRFSWTREVK